MCPKNYLFCIPTNFLPQPFDIFTQIYLSYLWHYATLSSTQLLIRAWCVFSKGDFQCWWPGRKFDLNPPFKVWLNSIDSFRGNFQESSWPCYYRADDLDTEQAGAQLDLLRLSPAESGNLDCCTRPSCFDLGRSQMIKTQNTAHIPQEIRFLYFLEAVADVFLKSWYLVQELPSWLWQQRLTW